MAPPPDSAADAADITQGIQAIGIMQAHVATILLTAIVPRNDNMAFMPIIDRVDENLSLLAKPVFTGLLGSHGKEDHAPPPVTPARRLQLRSISHA